jgi:hypothetical protein
VQGDELEVNLDGGIKPFPIRHVTFLFVFRVGPPWPPCLKHTRRVRIRVGRGNL